MKRKTKDTPWPIDYALVALYAFTRSPHRGRRKKRRFNLKNPLIRDWRPRHVLKVGHTTGDRYCHQDGRGSSWPCPAATRTDRWIVRLGGRSR